jgi:hypothetical protein
MLSASSQKALFPPQYREPPTKAHGRIEFRHITVIPLESGDAYLSNAKQAIRIVRVREEVKTKKISVEVVYCLTSAEPEKYTPKQLLEFNRNHWAIEATHHIRDNTFQEDRSTKKLGAEFMAAVRAFAIGLLNLLGFPDTARTTRALRYATLA